MLTQLGSAADRLVRRYMPDPFVLVLALTMITFVASVLTLHFRGLAVAAGAHELAPVALWTAFGRTSDFLFAGFAELLTFAMQLVLMVGRGEAIALSPPVARTIRRAAEIPRTSGGALLLVSVVALGLGWFHWGFGLMAAATFAR